MAKCQTGAGGMFKQTETNKGREIYNLKSLFTTNGLIHTFEQPFIDTSQYPDAVCLIPVSSVNKLRPRQNGRHFPDDKYKLIFSNEYVFNISLKFVPKGPINNIAA